MHTKSHGSHFGDYIEPGYKPGRKFMKEEAYAQALDTLVVACVDIAPIYKGKMLLGKRTRHPQADWFIFGGRMHAGEQVFESARRLAEIEMGLSVPFTRFSFLTTFSAAWKLRAHEPSQNGTHTTSITLSIEFDDEDLDSMRLNDEYSEYKLIEAEELLQDEAYHPALFQCAYALKERGLV